MFYRLLILFYALVLRTEPPVGGFDPPQLLRFAWSHENGSFLAQQPVLWSSARCLFCLLIY